MTSRQSDPTAAAHHFLSGCLQAGLAHVVVSPGSRSTPLVVALDQVERLSWSMHLDERSAAFAALGHAKASGRSVGLVCTSGTAAANYLPAISEASLSGVPLVVITADRPPEHQSWGVGQAFDQVGLYHRQVREQILMPVGADGGLAHAVRAGWRATWTALDSCGPVHVNWPFRFPLEQTGPLPDVPELSGGQPVAQMVSSIDLERFSDLVESTDHGVMVAGPGTIRPGPGADERQKAILEFAGDVGWPILADALSGLRGPSPMVVDAADRVVAMRGGPGPAELVLRLGDTPTAKSIRLWWEELTACPHVLIDPLATWQDPSHRFDHRFAVDAASLLANTRRSTRSDRRWSTEWIEQGRRARAIVDAQLAASASWTEVHLARRLSAALPPDATLVVASSMPVRDLDSYSSSSSEFEVLSNRGINGIDGVVATAIGVARARPASRLVVYIGDVALLHDVGSVLDAVRQQVDMTLVVPNNDGGGIFSFLPIRSALGDDRYRELFHTPHGSDFGFLGAVEGVTHRRITSADFDDEFEAAGDRPGVHLLEATVSTSQRMTLEGDLSASLRTAFA